MLTSPPGVKLSIHPSIYPYLPILRTLENLRSLPHAVDLMVYGIPKDDRPRAAATRDCCSLPDATASPNLYTSVWVLRIHTG